MYIFVSRQTMKTFDIPTYYRSSIIGKVKSYRTANDHRKKDFSPTLLDFGVVKFHIPRHFGFCYGVENAIEISYKAIHENPDKRIFLLSQMIHNPGVNADLLNLGVRFLQDTEGQQLIPWTDLVKDDIVIIPAFGTTIDIENKLSSIGIQAETYNTTCPFVEKVWKRSKKLGEDKHTVIIHGKHQHEETRATFSHASVNAKSIVVKDLSETKLLAQYITGEKDISSFNVDFGHAISDGFNPNYDFDKIGVVNQTTMLASDTQEITDYLYSIYLSKYGEEIKAHFANTRDTLCYATNDNQTSTKALLDLDADIAIVIGGYNSSNTSHLAELLDQKFRTYFIKDETEISENGTLDYLNQHENQMKSEAVFVENLPNNIVISSGASCPDAVVDRVLQKILNFYNNPSTIESVLSNFNL